MPLETGLFDLLQSLVLTVGAPIVVILFFFDGMVVGKMVSPATLYIIYVAAGSPPTSIIVIVGTACIIASTLGQLTLYRGFNEDSEEFVGLRRRIPALERMPRRIRRRVGRRRMESVSAAFDRFGGWGIALTNFIPGIRSLMSIPAGLSRYSVERFLIFSTIGNAIYITILTFIGWGVLEVYHLLRIP